MEVSSFFRSRAASVERTEGTVDAPAGVITAADSAARLGVLDDFEQAGIGWIWATDAEGRLIYLSENASERLGKPVAELLAQPLVAVFETDPDNPDERSDRPLNFQLNARS
jgi:PAS domain-containing protein